jgi:hypothetical protein
VFEFVPTLIPFTFHWYAGKGPPLLGVAVMVTDDPGQKGFGTALMLTPVGNPVSTIIVMQLDVAGFPETQGRDEVRTQHTISPAIGV